MDEIVQRTASAMVKRGVPFTGVLFAGLMIKDGRVSAGCCTTSYIPKSATMRSSTTTGMAAKSCRGIDKCQLSCRRGYWSTMCALETRSASA